MERKALLGGKTKGYLVVALAVLMIMVVAAMPVAAQGMTQYRIPASAFFGPIENPCSGEIMQPFGWVLWSELETRNGFVLHISGLGGYLVGESSGDVYQLNGALQWVVQNGSNETYVHSFRLIGSEPGQSFHLHQLYHASYTPDGNLRVEFETLDAECR